MNTYKDFLKKLLVNYFIGSFIAVFGIGSLFMFSTLIITAFEIGILVFILCISIVCMGLCEWFAFTKHIDPIKRVFKNGDLSLEAIENAFRQTHRFPLLTVYRIFGPHLFGLSIPAVLMAALFIRYDLLSLPLYYTLLASVGAVLIAGMHSIIEFFLSSKAVKPMLINLRNKALMLYGADLTSEAEIHISIQQKVLYSAIYIGVFPLLLFTLATQIRFQENAVPLLSEYWSWAILILMVSVLFAVFGAFLLFKNISEPIEKLQDGMSEVEQGILSYRNEVYSDEFSKLIAGFNKMIRGLRERDQINSQLLESLYTTLALALDARDPYTAGHSVRVAEYSVLIGREAGLSEESLDTLRKSALLHDIGKIGIRDSILLKEGRLTHAEFEEIKKHPVIGAGILSNVQPGEMMEPLIPGVKYHHERYDGMGYPEGLTGTDIPLYGRIMAVADAYDAMTSDRPYRRGMAAEKAMSIIKEGKGTQWDPVFAELFLNVMNGQNGEESKSV
ncbi:HD domain-containing protein [Metabacillus idriensis]|uniref:HD domain-containing phosphohydrolase n=1 Tax=Metabacillus idriensis TaxID=324768 RepID=UPI002814905D|nr:HD domain-containing phosphohydrolase [Metabacillus idriensis]MDR0137074.1 HD domain-containing protein [Metabacillus idriensis]